MLSIVFTTHKLLAGVHGDSAKILPIQTHNYIPFDERSPTQVFSEHLTEIQAAYQKWHKGPLQSPAPTTLALPSQMDEGIRQELAQMIEGDSAPELRLIHNESLAQSYLRGLSLEPQNYLVLECLEDYLNLCFSLDQGNNNYHQAFPEIGRDASNQTLLAELVKRFESIGLVIKEEGRQDLLRQLGLPTKDYAYTMSRSQDNVSLEAEATFSRDEFMELSMKNRFQLKEVLSKGALNEKDIKKVVLLGQYLRNDAFVNYLKDDLHLGDLLYSTERTGPWTEYETIINGLFRAGNAFLHKEEAEKLAEEQRQREEEARRRKEAAMRAKITSELKVKQNRDSLLAEISKICVDPSLVAQYEENFVSRGAELGIPEMIIKWNISEVLSKVSLEQTQEKLGDGVEDASELDALMEELPMEVNTLADIANDQVETTEETAKIVEEATEEEVAASEDTSVTEEVKEESEEVVEEVTEEVAPIEAVEEEEAAIEEEAVEAVVEVEATEEAEVEEVAEIEEEVEEVAEIAAAVEATEEIQVEEVTEIAAAVEATEETQAEEVAAIEEKIEETVEEVVEAEASQEVAEEAEDDDDITGDESVQEMLEIAEESEEATEEAIEAILAEGEEDLKEVFAPAENKPMPSSNGNGSVKEKVLEPAAALASSVKTLTKELSVLEQKNLSLSDIFTIKGNLPDPEFATKRVMMKGDPEPKVVRVLGVKDLKSAERRADFQVLYQKELTYYQSVSQLAEAKEGMYYYREYIERQTLKQYVKKLGLTDKSTVEDLSSQDLKFILQIFKEVQDLPIAHANLSEENILVVSKRKWNLQKNLSIHFVGFTSEEISKDEMIKQTHKMFSRTLGNNFYKDFRKKFQL